MSNKRVSHAGRQMTALQRRCWNTAQWHLEHETQDAFDMCAETGQMLDNIKHTRMAVVMMANWLIEDTATYAELEPFKDKVKGLVG